jgi:hypothetical protein
MDRELTVSEARRLKLPDADPLSGEEVVWAPIPARKTSHSAGVPSFESVAAIAGAILGDGAAA